MKARLQPDPQVEEHIAQTRSDARELAQRGRARFEQAKSRTVSTMDGATTSLGKRVEAAGQSLESAGRSAGDRMRRAGTYMQSASPGNMGEDFVALMRQHPGATLCVGIGIGLVAGRLLSTSGRK